MGMANIKWEAEVFQIQQQPFQFPPGNTPVETKPDISLLTQIAGQINQLSMSVNQLHQTVAGQAFTRPVQQGLGEQNINMDEIRKLNQRLDELEARLPGANG